MRFDLYTKEGKICRTTCMPPAKRIDKLLSLGWVFVGSIWSFQLYSNGNIRTMMEVLYPKKGGQDGCTGSSDEGSTTM